MASTSPPEATAANVTMTNMPSPSLPSQNENQTQNPFGFTGYQTDEISGLYYAQLRFYNPNIGRFGAEDPIKDQLNWYGYCGANPTGFIDPMGLMSLNMDFLYQGGGGGGGLNTPPTPSNPPSSTSTPAPSSPYGPHEYDPTFGNHSSSSSSSTPAPSSPYGPHEYDPTFGNHSSSSSSDDCAIQRGAMGFINEFNHGGADGFMDFFRGLHNAATNPVGTLTNSWEEFRNAPFRFLIDEIVFNPFNPTTPLRNIVTGVRDEGVYGLGYATGWQSAVATTAVVGYVAVKSVAALNTVVIGVVTGTLGQGVMNVVKSSWKSVKEFGHSFSRHGAGARNTRALAGRAASTGQSQGQWINNQEAANFLNSLGNITETKTVNIPRGLGQVITPTGEIIPATRAIIVPSPTGIKTAYPIP